MYPNKPTKTVSLSKTVVYPTVSFWSMLGVPWVLGPILMTSFNDFVETFVVLCSLCYYLVHFIGAYTRIPADMGYG